VLLLLCDGGGVSIDDGTQRLMLTKQALYHLSYIPSLLMFVYFAFKTGTLDSQASISLITRMTGVRHHAQIVLVLYFGILFFFSH
jgi:hypothetical protein